MSRATMVIRSLKQHEMSMVREVDARISACPVKLARYCKHEMISIHTTAMNIYASSTFRTTLCISPSRRFWACCIAFLGQLHTYRARISSLKPTC